METESVSKLDGNVQRGSLLASFPRDFPRENEEGNRGRVGTSTLGPPGKGSGHSSAGWTRRNGQRGIVGKKSKKLWSRVGSFLSRRAREMAPDQKGGTRGKEGGRSGSYK